MPRWTSIGAILACLMAGPAWAAPAATVPRPADPAPLRFSLVKTAEAHGQEGMVFEGGSLFKPVTINHVAVLVSHPGGNFLFDTGLGRRVDDQFGQEMSWWAKPLLAYGPVTPARDQLEAAGLPPVGRIIESHGHWDHASGLVDFPEAEVWVTEDEGRFLAQAGPPVVLRSQIDPPSIRWRIFELEDRPFASYARSLDLYGDGSAVLVPMPGHTPGSVGLFLTVASGRQYFFVGDTVWKVEAVARQAPKFWLAGWLVDHDGRATDEAVRQLHALMEANPALTIVPAHDAEVQDALGYFPKWVE